MSAPSASLRCWAFQSGHSSRWDTTGIGPPKIKVAKLILFDLGKLTDWLPSRNRYPPVRRVAQPKEKVMSEVTNSETTPDPFNPAALRLDQSYADTVGVRKLLTTVPVRKPNRQEFVRVHPDLRYRLTPAATIEVKEDREVYLVTPNMAQLLPGEFSTVTLFTTINRQGTLQLWPVKLPIRMDGKTNGTVRQPKRRNGR